MLRDCRINGEQNDEEENANGEYIWLEIWIKKTSLWLRIIDQESDERTNETNFILKAIIGTWISGEQSFYAVLKRNRQRET